MTFLSKPKKSLGQNFLIDRNIINKIVNIANIHKNKIVLEIGPGYGNLTNRILDMNPNKIFAIEKDEKISSHLQNHFKKSNKIKIINEDILNIIDKKTFGQNVTVIGNLPYNISTQILASFILLEKWPPWYEKLIFMFQKEVANRIIAKKNTKDFGRLTVLSNWRLEIKKHFEISKNSFKPKPKIDSTILSFKPLKNSEFKIKDPMNLEMVTRILFSNRRKMLNKNFLKLFKNNKNAADDLNLNLNLRPGELSNEMYYKITMKYEKLFG